MNLKQIIQHECACYFRAGPYGVKDWCEPRDSRCIAFGEFKRCGYFENGVLPAQSDASAEYKKLCEGASIPMGADCSLCREPCKQSNGTIVVRCPHYSGIPVPSRPTRLICEVGEGHGDTLALDDITAKMEPVPPTAARRATCHVCGSRYQARSNRQQYCSTRCAGEGRRLKNKERQRKRRAGTTVAV